MSLADEINSSGVLLEKARAKATRRQMAQEKATKRQWELVELAIEAFAAKYPFQWNAFVMDQKMSQNEMDYSVGIGELKKSNYRHSASFPVIIQNGEVVDSLYPVLEKIIPGLTSPKSKNFITFLKKFPIFSPGHKVAAGE